MQAIPAFLASTGVSATTAISAASAAIGGVSAISQANYQSRVAKNNAVIAANNATQVRQETAVNNMMRDQEARSDIGAMLAQGGASGLSLGVGSMGLRRKSMEELAARDRELSTYAGDTRAAGFDQQSQDFTSEARSARTAGAFNAAGAGINFGSSFISDAPTVNAATSARITGRIRPRARGE